MNIKFQEKLITEKEAHNSAATKLTELMSSLETENQHINEIKEQLDEKHKKEMEELRTYFEQKCTDLEKQ